MNMASRFLGTCFAFASLVTVAVANLPQDGQQIKAKPYEPRKIVLSPQPVSKAEANKIFARVNLAIAKVVPGLRMSTTRLVGDKPITRQEIVDEFDRIFRMCKPGFKFTPRKVSYNPTLLTIKDKPTRSKLQNLISWGCVDKVGVLATAKKDTVGVLEFGDAVGFLTARVAELTHMPDPKFSPDLQEP